MHTQNHHFDTPVIWTYSMTTMYFKHHQNQISNISVNRWCAVLSAYLTTPLGTLLFMHIHQWPSKVVWFITNVNNTCLSSCLCRLFLLCCLLFCSQVNLILVQLKDEQSQTTVNAAGKGTIKKGSENKPPTEGTKGDFKLVCNYK